LLALVVVIVLAGVSIAIAARGDSEEDKKPTGSNLTTISCPLEETGELDAGGQPELRPAKGAFDTAVLIDLPLEQARQKAAEKGCEIAVSVQDGAGQPVPIELNPKLIYVYVEKGRVTRIEGVGGGI
jgi:hypothetical protein